MSASNNSVPSTPAKAAAVAEKLTERELEILSKAWGCMKTTPEVSWHSVFSSHRYHIPMTFSLLILSPPLPAKHEADMHLFQHQVDYAKLAAACGMTNTGSASNAWGKIKKKLFLDVPGASTPSTTVSTSKKRQSGGRKKQQQPAKAVSPANADGEDEDDLDEAVEETPTKKRRIAKPKKLAATVKKETKREDDVDEDDDELDAGAA